MNTAQLVHDVEYLEQRAQQAPKLNSIYIFPGYVQDTKQAQKLQVIHPIEAGGQRTFGDQFTFFKQRTFGNFTAVFNPNREIIYFQNIREGVDDADDAALLLQGHGIQGHLDLPALIRSMSEKDMRIRELEAEVSALKAALDDERSLEGKFAFGLDRFLQHFFPQQSTPQTPIQGTPMSEWTSAPITSDEDALAVIVEAMGMDWLHKFARRIQKEPHLVGTIKTYIQ